MLSYSIHMWFQDAWHCQDVKSATSDNTNHDCDGIISVGRTPELIQMEAQKAQATVIGIKSTFKKIIYANTEIQDMYYNRKRANCGSVNVNNPYCRLTSRCIAWLMAQEKKISLLQNQQYLTGAAKLRKVFNHRQSNAVIENLLAKSADRVTFWDTALYSRR